MSRPRFIHLHTRSEYSMIDGLSKIDMLLKRAAFLKMPALALTDFNNLFGFIKFYESAYQLGIKPIVGADFLVQEDYDELSSLTCLVSTQQGYYHLIKLISKAYKNISNNIRPTIQYNWLMEYNEGLIILSGGLNGNLGKSLLKNKKLNIERCLSFYNKYFLNRYYVELIRTDRQHEEHYIQLAVELSINKGLPVVATNDVRFINATDFQAHEVRVAIHDGVILNNKKTPCMYSTQQFMKNEEEMCILFNDIPEALTNSVEIARRCNFIIELGGSYLPQFPTGTMSTEDFLTTYAQKGLEERLIVLFPNVEKRHIKRIPYDLRLTHELKVINQMGFPGYFLIVMEFIQWAKNNNIPVGPGRGSGASSLVAYALKITELDPIQFDLLFERFLNPERISMPDLDIDFCMERRDLVIDHVVQTYGIDAVSQIITFGTMAAKAVIRDVGRVLGHSYTFTNRIAKLIPSEVGITLKQAILAEPQLKALYNNDEEIKILIDMAQQLEGIIKNISKHAGGVVIAPVKITDFSPLYYDRDSAHPMTQFDKDDIARIGLIKFDFLGLRTLTIIDRTLNMVNTLRCEQNLPIIDINSISLYDQKSFHLLQTAETTAVFQLESYGIKKIIKRLKPDCFEDLIALIALFRPGPLQSGMVDNFIDRKHGREIISYPDNKWQHESLRPVLESTYGIILYQEQVMQIAQVLAGYTLGNADILRRAIGKKKLEDMVKQRSIFNTGATRHGIDHVLSTKIFDLVEKFAGYGFNKSHSAAYALISYQTLWLKTHYPAEFMSAVLSADMDNSDKMVHLINECKRMELTVLPPDLNSSQYYFYVNDKKEIIYGIGAIKGIGKTSIDAIVTSRNQNGKFKGLLDFCIRIDSSKINQRMLEKLIFSGACDSFEISRSQLISSLNDTIKYANQYLKKKHSKQINMFEICLDNIHFQKNNNNDITLKYSKWFLLEKEREVLGLYLTNHPTMQYINEIKKYIPHIESIKNITLLKNKMIMYVFGIIVAIRITLNYQGNRIIFCMLEDYSGKLEILVLSQLINKYQYCLKENNVLFVQGIVHCDTELKKCKIIAQKLEDINDIRNKYVRRLSIILNYDQINNHILNNLCDFLKKNKYGKLPVYFFIKKHELTIKLRCGKNWNITLTNQLLINLRNLVGYNHIILD